MNGPFDIKLPNLDFPNPKNNVYVGCQFLNITTNKNALRWGWEGIPFNVILDSVLFLMLICLFGIMRRKAWKSKNLPESSKHWLHFIYGDREHSLHNHLNRLEFNSVNDHEHDLRYQQLTKLMKDNENYLRETDRLDHDKPLSINCTCDFQNNNLKESKPAIEKEASHEDPSFQNTNYYTSELGHWLLNLLLIKDSDILKKRGPDAVHYLIFQKYIIRFLAILTFICVFVILPINVTGEVKLKSFAQTTIANLQPNSSKLWVHVSFSAFLLVVSLWMMCHFSRIINADTNQYIRRTLLINNVPKKKRTSEDLHHYFEGIFPNIKIDGIQFVYDTRRLRILQTEFDASMKAKKYCAEQNKQIYLRTCCLLPTCLCCPYKTKATDYYKSQIDRLKIELVKEFFSKIGKPLGSVFVTFRDVHMARTVFQHFTELKDQSWTTTCLIRGLKYCPNRFIPYDVERSDGYMPERWEVVKAPYPDEINWNDIGIKYKWVWIKRIAVHFLIIMVFFIFSTPFILINFLNHFKINESIIDRLSHITPAIREFYAPLLYIIFSSMLPLLIQFTCDYLPYKTLTEKNNSVMWKVFFFLLMMVIILPSLGLTSLKNFFMQAINNSSHTVQCLFPVDNGAFFVNYVIQSSFISNAVELLRFGEIFLYFVYYFCFTKSEAEFEKIRKMIYFDFQFGIRYPRFLLIFCMVVTYSLTCPVIAPVGLFYMTIKHFVDRYNIYYVYTPSKISASIHSTAITFFQIAIVMMLVQMSTFIALKTGSSYMTTFSVVILFAALVLFFCQCFCHCCWNIGANLPAKRKTQVSQKNFCSCAYLPPVLYEIDLSEMKNLFSVCSCTVEDPNQELSLVAPQKSI